MSCRWQPTAQPVGRVVALRRRVSEVFSGRPLDCARVRRIRQIGNLRATAFRDLVPKIQISSGGGFDPVWRRSGGELFYRNDNKMMVVAVNTAHGIPRVRAEDAVAGQPLERRRLLMRHARGRIVQLRRDA